MLNHLCHEMQGIPWEDPGPWEYQTWISSLISSLTKLSTMFCWVWGELWRAPNAVLPHVPCNVPQQLLDKFNCPPPAGFLRSSQTHIFLAVVPTVLLPIPSSSHPIQCTLDCTIPLQRGQLVLWNPRDQTIWRCLGLWPLWWVNISAGI